MEGNVQWSDEITRGRHLTHDMIVYVSLLCTCSCGTHVHMRSNTGTYDACRYTVH